LKWTARSPIGHAFHPPYVSNIPPNFRCHKQGRRFVPRPIRRTKKRPPAVDCGMVDFLDRDKWSSSVLSLRFGQGIKPPRRRNFTQNMHPYKRCRRSLARPNRTTPKFHDVNHGVAVGQPRRFCVIEPTAFVGGMGGWFCWTRCAVVFTVVLRSCAGYFLFHVNKVHRCA